MRQIVLLSSFLMMAWTANAQLSFNLGVPGLPTPDTTKKPDPRSVIKPYGSLINSNFTTQRGLFTIHRYKDTVYFEIPDSLLGRDIEVISRLVKGPGGSSTYSGEEIYERTIQFEGNSADSSIRIRRHFVISEADSNTAIHRTVVSSYENPILISFPIKAINYEHASYLVDVSAYLKTAMNLVNDVDRTNLINVVDPRGMRDFFLEKFQAFPMNVEITMSKNGMFKANAGFGVTAGDPVTIVTQTSFIALPKVPMERRVWDERVGFFTDYVMSFGDAQQRVENRRFILRWRMEPRDEDMEKWKRGELVEPKKPIVIYIDPATPKVWRPYLIAGINDWQKAFEQAGFKNAIMGKEWPEGDSSMSLGDARYSVLNYLPSEIENAYGPQVHDPRSGEIIQTHIGWYHNVMQLLHEWYMIQAAAVDSRARKAVFDNELMGQLIRFVSSHEVGHTLGLLHNFGSSSQTPVDSLRSKTWLDIHGHTASIMDYARFNYVAQPEDHLPQYDLFPRIGEYDKWAIEYGYKYINAGSFEEDKKIMRQLIVDSTSKNPRLWFGDGENRKIDPRCQTEDLGDNAAKASIYGIKNLKRILPHLQEWTYERGGTFDNLEEMYKALQGQYFRYVRHVVGNIGGVYVSVHSEDQAGPLVQPTPVNLQRDAMSFMDKEVFTTPLWLLDTSITSKVSLPVNPDFVEDLQVKALNSMLDTIKLGKLIAGQRQFGNKAYSVDEYVGTLHGMIWKELATGKAVEPYRRSLQKSYIGCLQSILLSGNPTSSETDIYTLVLEDMIRLKGEISAAIPKVTDSWTRHHLQDIQMRIKRTLGANQMIQ